jgi:hypothetical protein
MATQTPTKTPRTTPPPRVKGDPSWGANGHDFEEVEHIVKHDDPDTALCGVDQTDVPWDQGFPWCEACRAIARGGMN